MHRPSSSSHSPIPHPDRAGIRETYALTRIAADCTAMTDSHGDERAAALRWSGAFALMLGLPARTRGVRTDSRRPEPTRT